MFPQENGVQISKIFENHHLVLVGYIKTSTRIIGEIPSLGHTWSLRDGHPNSSWMLITNQHQQMASLL